MRSTFVNHTISDIITMKTLMKYAYKITEPCFEKEFNNNSYDVRYSLQ